MPTIMGNITPTLNTKTHYITTSGTLSAARWSSDVFYMTGVNFEITGAAGLGQLSKTWNLKMIVVDLASNATLEQRKAAEEACIYASYSTMQPGDETLWDYFINIGITSDTAPTVDIPITVTAMFEE